MNTEEIAKRNDSYVMPIYNHLEVAFARGEGARLYDVEGCDYIDFGSGIGVSSVGHGNKRLVNALCEQAQKLIHTSNLYWIVNQANLAQRIIELSKMPMKVFFANSGAEANEAAIKLARKYGETYFEKKRYKIVTFKSSFHGRTLATLAATGQEHFHRFFSPFPEGFVIAENLQDIYHKIDEETCGVLLELVQGEGGVRAFPKEEIQNLERFLKEKKILLMIDEVQSGIYRTGTFLASQGYEIFPDVITLAKGLGGGVPIGAMMSKYGDILQAGDHGSTFGGNCLSTRAGMEVLEILSEEARSGALQKRIDLFHSKLDILCQKQGFVCKTGLGLMLGLEAKNEQIRQDFIAQAFQKRVLVLRSGQNLIRFLPPLTISEEEIEEGFARLGC